MKLILFILLFHFIHLISSQTVIILPTQSPVDQLLYGQNVDFTQQAKDHMNVTWTGFHKTTIEKFKVAIQDDEGNDIKTIETDGLVYSALIDNLSLEEGKYFALVIPIFEGGEEGQAILSKNFLLISSRQEAYFNVYPKVQSVHSIITRNYSIQFSVPKGTSDIDDTLIRFYPIYEFTEDYHHPEPKDVKFNEFCSFELMSSDITILKKPIEIRVDYFNDAFEHTKRRHQISLKYYKKDSGWISTIKECGSNTTFEDVVDRINNFTISATCTLGYQFAFIAFEVDTLGLQLGITFGALVLAAIGCCGLWRLYIWIGELFGKYKSLLKKLCCGSCTKKEEDDEDEPLKSSLHDLEKQSTPLSNQ